MAIKGSTPAVAASARTADSERPTRWIAATAGMAWLLAVLGTDACVVRREGAGPLGAGASPGTTTSGEGGAGANGGSSTGQGGTEGNLTWTADPPGNPAAGYELPAWLAFESPSNDRTTQTSENTLVRGFGPDVPRPRNVGRGWGLCIEPERTNLATNSDSWGDGAGWQIGSMAKSVGHPDPAGGSGATRFDTGGNDGSHFFVPGAVPNPITGSTWTRGAGGEALYSRFYVAGTTTLAMAPVDSDVWERVSGTCTDLERIAFHSFAIGRYPGIGKAATFFAFGAQLEPAANYPSSYIPTSDSAVVRAAESLSASGADVAPDGWFDVTLVIAPHYASGENIAEHDLLYFDADNRVFIRQDGSIVLRSGGANIETAPLTWERDAQLSVVARSSSEVTVISVSGAGRPFETSGAPTDPLVPPPRRVFILGGPAGAQEGADLRSIEIAR